MSCVAGRDQGANLAELSAGGKENRTAPAARQQCDGASGSCGHESKGASATKMKRRDSVNIAKLSKVAVDKMLEKIKNKYMFVDSLHPADAALAIKQAADCIVDGIVREQPVVVSQEAAQKIAHEAGTMMSSMFSLEGAEKKAREYLSSEIVRFSAHLVQRG